MDDRQLLKNFIRSLSGAPTLNEQDDPFGGEEETEEETEEEAEEETEEETEDDAGGDKADNEEASPDAGTDDSLDGELAAIFVDIESKSMKSENVDRYSLSYHLLNEQDEGSASLDVDKFAEQTARIFRNVEAFLDIDEIILKKASEFVADNHGDEKAEQLLNILKNRYNIVGKKEKESAEADAATSVPIAVGATGGAGA